jgi:hypothetical protein
MRGRFSIALATVTMATAVFAPAIATLAGVDRGSARTFISRTAQTETTPQQSDAPAARPDAPAPDKSIGTPAAVLDDQEVDSILGKSVRSSANENMGRVVDVLVSRNGKVRGVVIDFGGFLGVGSRKIAIDWNALRFTLPEKAGQISVDLSKDQLRVAPEYKSGEPVVILGAMSPTGAPGSSPPAQDK